MSPPVGAEKTSGRRSSQDRGGRKDRGNDVKKYGRDRREKERVTSTFTRSEMIEYRYANFDVAKAAEDYAQVVREIGDLQLEIDLANQTQTFEVEL